VACTHLCCLRLLRQDVAAGVTVGVLLIPQSMSYAILSGLPPIYGMYACTIPLFVYAAFASSTQLQIGTVATTSILLQSTVASMAPASTEEFIRIAIAVTFITGVIQILMGLMRIGFLATLLSWPVMSGFTSASACIIGVSQLKYFFGISLPSVHSFFPKLYYIVKGIPSLHVPTTLLSLFTLVCLMLAKSRLRLPKWFPMQLALIVFTTTLSFIFDLESLGIAIVGMRGLRSAIVRCCQRR
jgi:SulP family sulfate permease